MDIEKVMQRGLGYAPTPPQKDVINVFFPNSREPKPEPKGRPLTIEETMFYNTNGEKQKLM